MYACDGPVSYLGKSRNIPGGFITGMRIHCGSMEQYPDANPTKFICNSMGGANFKRQTLVFEESIMCV